VEKGLAWSEEKKGCIPLMAKAKTSRPNPGACVEAGKGMGGGGRLSALGRSGAWDAGNFGEPVDDVVVGLSPGGCHLLGGNEGEERTHQEAAATAQEKKVLPVEPPSS